MIKGPKPSYYRYEKGTQVRVDIPRHSHIPKGAVGRVIARRGKKGETPEYLIKVPGIGRVGSYLETDLGPV